jgi:hypothetical protein
MYNVSEENKKNVNSKFDKIPTVVLYNWLKALMNVKGSNLLITEVINE